MYFCVASFVFTLLGRSSSSFVLWVDILNWVWETVATVSSPRFLAPALGLQFAVSEAFLCSPGGSSSVPRPLRLHPPPSSVLPFGSFLLACLPRARVCFPQ